MRRRIELALLVGVLTPSLLLAGCKTGPVEPKIEYRTANVAVSVGCVVNKPDPVIPLNQQISTEQWDAMPTGAKAEAVKAQAGERMNHNDKMAAATSSCKPAPTAPP